MSQKIVPDNWNLTTSTSLPLYKSINTYLHVLLRIRKMLNVAARPVTLPAFFTGSTLHPLMLPFGKKALVQRIVVYQIDQIGSTEQATGSSAQYKEYS